MDEVIAEVLPTEKAAVIERLQASGRRVAMVGDGQRRRRTATANLGLAVLGHRCRLKSADVILLRRTLRRHSDAIVLALSTLRTIQGNLVWARLPTSQIPLAAAGCSTC